MMLFNIKDVNNDYFLVTKRETLCNIWVKHFEVAEETC